MSKLSAYQILLFLSAQVLATWAFAIDASAVLASQISSYSNSYTFSGSADSLTLFDKLNTSILIEAGQSTSTTNYNENVDDITVRRTSALGGLQLDWDQMIFLAAEAGQEKVENNDVLTLMINSNVGFKLFNTTLRYRLSDSYVRQKESFIILTKDIKDQATVRKTAQTLSLTYTGFENLSFSVSRTEYKYDTDVELLLAVATTKASLNSNGAAFASQINSLTDYENRLDVIYSFNELWDIEVGFGEAKDYLDPYSKSKDLRLGSTLYFKNYSISLGLTALESDGDDKKTNSGDLSLSVDL